jgi:CcmD family protein
MTYLYAAYAATWIVHITYLVTVVQRYGKLKKEFDELKRK